MSKKPYIVILGAGESGVGTALLAIQKGYEVFVSDKSEIKEKYKAVLIENQIPFEEGSHDVERILKADWVMKSPGIPDKVPLVKQLKEKGIPVISEIEFAAQYTQATIFGITGSNGKTTTTMMLYHILQKAGFNVAEGGNIGESFAALVAQNKHDYYVLELSSFQLDGIVKFTPHIANLKATLTASSAPCVSTIIGMTFWKVSIILELSTPKQTMALTFSRTKGINSI